MTLKIVTIFILLVTSVYGQKEKWIIPTEGNESYGPRFIPHELKYGGIIRDSKYNSQLYIAYLLIGKQIKVPNDKRAYFSLGSSYSRMFKSDNISLFPYLGRASWYGSHCGVKVEPLFNIQKRKFEYTNVEFLFGWYLGLSFVAGIPNNFDKNSPYYGFKIGWAMQVPIFEINK